MKKRLLGIICLVLSVLFTVTSLVACGDTNNPDNPDNPTTEISLDKTSATVKTGETVTITVKNYDGTVTWETSAASVATVSGGVVTGVSEGTAFITATAGETKLTCTVKVVEQAYAVPTLVVDHKSATIGKGFTLTLKSYLFHGEEQNEITEGVTYTSSDEAVVSVADGAVTGLKVGTASVTASYVYGGKTLTATVEFEVVNVNYCKTYVGETEVTALNPVRVNVADAYFGSTASSATVSVKEIDIKTGAETDVSDKIVWMSSDEAVATGNGGTITGGTKNGGATLTGVLDGVEVTGIEVEGFTEITTIAQMDKLALVTWDYKNDVETAKKYLAGNYVLGADIDYAGQRILPIANVGVKVTTVDKNEGWWNDSDLGQQVSYNSFIWRDILTAYDNRGTADWRTVKAATAADAWATLKTAWEDANNYNKAGVANFMGVNPSNLPFTGIFDGNGYSIKHAQIIYANAFNMYRGGRDKWYAAGACVFGENQGTITGIDFYDLRYTEQYGEADGVTGGSGVLKTGEGSAIYSTSGGNKLGYANNHGASKFGGLLRYNKGTFSNIKVTFTTVDDYTWDYWNDYKLNSSATSLGICYNKGLMENVVLVFVGKSEGFGEHLSSSGLGGSVNTLYTVNKEDGIIKNCVVLSELTASTQHKVNGLIHYGEDNETTYNNNASSTVPNYCMVGTIVNCTRKINDGTVSAMKQYLNDANYDKSSFAANWIIDAENGTMTLKKG